ncbi:MAG TPA: cytochrome c family protein [Xanthobacteraceae bacterium]|nr:cytochrome c family protein [Xanthobacteraceae bacterium]
MDSFELNKILGAVLGTCLVLLSLNITAGALFAPQKPAKPGYDIVVPEKPAEEGKPPAPEEPIAKLLASADLKRGEAAAKKCMACHTFQKGGPNLVGPNLWGIVNRPKASVANFNYSQSMRAKGGNWGFEELNEYLLNPRKVVPGTIMNFPGITRASERADVILYLNSLSDNPAPLPKAAAAPGATQQAARAGQATQR